MSGRASKQPPLLTRIRGDIWIPRWLDRAEITALQWVLLRNKD